MSNYYKNDDISFKPFTREQENELFKRASEGDVEARDQIIKNYLQFAAYEGLSEARGEFEEDDVLSAANWGLMTAVQRYDYRKGNGFSAFARRFIRGRVGHLRRARIRQANREISIGVGNAETHSDTSDDSTRRRGLGSGLIQPEGLVDHEFEEQEWRAFWLEHIKKFITKLAHNEQIAVNVVIFEEGDFKQLAHRLKITPHNARRTYVRAIEALKKLARKVQT